MPTGTADGHEILPDDAEKPSPAPLSGIVDALPRTTGAAALSRSRLVRKLRVFFPVLSVVLVAAIALNTRPDSADSVLLDDFRIPAPRMQELRMESPRFSGMDNRGVPYEIRADRASGGTGHTGPVSLYNPRAVQGTDGNTSVLAARRGTYIPEDNVLELENDVTLQHRTGDAVYRIRTPSLAISFNDETITGNAGINGRDPYGNTVTADRFRAYRAGNRLVLEGNVSMQIPSGEPVLRPADTERGPGGKTVPE